MAEKATVKYRMLNTNKTMKQVGVTLVVNGASVTDTVYVSPGAILDVRSETKPEVPAGVKILAN